MTKKIIIAFIAIIIIIVAIVQFTKPVTTSAPNSKLPEGSVPAGDPALLVGPTWVWEKTIMATSTPFTPNKVGVFTLTFTADGRASGTTDCNGVSGTYTVGSDGIITFGPLAMTKMFCEGSEEAVFADGISSVKSYMLGADGSLTLALDADKGSMIFKKK